MTIRKWSNYIYNGNAKTFHNDCLHFRKVGLNTLFLNFPNIYQYIKSLEIFLQFEIPRLKFPPKKSLITIS